MDDRAADCKPWACKMRSAVASSAASTRSKGEVGRQITEGGGRMMGNVVGDARKNGNSTHVSLSQKPDNSIRPECEL